MNCAEFEREWQELDDLSLLSPGMDEHIQACAGCARLVREVNRLRWEAQQLMAAEQPPDRVWANIRSQLSHEGVLREPGAQSWLNGILTFAWLPRLPMGVAYASVFFLALVGVDYVRDRATPPPVAVSSVPQTPVESAAADPAVAREEAVASATVPAPEPLREEERVIQEAIKKAPPERRQIYLTRWQQLNSSSDVLRSFVAAHPDDRQALLQLSEIQEQQKRLLELVVRRELEEF